MPPDGVGAGAAPDAVVVVGRREVAVGAAATVVVGRAIVVVGPKPAPVVGGEVAGGVSD